jgi:hypothetical protein
MLTTAFLQQLEPNDFQFFHSCQLTAVFLQLTAHNIFFHS